MDDPECDYVHPHALPLGTALMVIDDRVERVDIDTTGILTRSGIGVGLPNKTSSGPTLARFAPNLIRTQSRRVITSSLSHGMRRIQSLASSSRPMVSTSPNTALAVSLQ